MSSMKDAPLKNDFADPKSPEYKSPLTLEGRKAIHQRLLEFSKMAIRDHKVTGLNGFIRSFNDARIERQIQIWLQKFSPIAVLMGKDGRVFYQAKLNINPEYDLGRGALEPYYSIEVPQEKIDKNINLPSRLPGPKINLSDREFEKKIIRLALEDVLKDPSQQNKDKAIKLIQGFRKAIRVGSPTVSAGLPSLGRRR